MFLRDINALVVTIYIKIKLFNFLVRVIVPGLNGRYNFICLEAGEPR